MRYVGSFAATFVRMTCQTNGACEVAFVGRSRWLQRARSGARWRRSTFSETARPVGAESARRAGCESSARGDNSPVAHRAPLGHASAHEALARTMEITMKIRTSISL